MIADAVGEPRELVEVVRRDEDRAVGPAQRVHDVAEALRPHGIEPVRGLVENDHPLVAQQRLREAEALQVALRELAHALVAMLLEPELLDHLVDARVTRVAPARRRAARSARSASRAATPAEC